MLKIQFGSQYAPSTKKIIFWSIEFFDKKFYMYIFIVYVRSSSFKKNQYFLWTM
jgi:hypothetical protein